MADHVLVYLFIFNRKSRTWLPEGNMKDLCWGRGEESGPGTRDRRREDNRKTSIIWSTRRHLNL